MYTHIHRDNTHTMSYTFLHWGKNIIYKTKESTTSGWGAQRGRYENEMTLI